VAASRNLQLLVLALLVVAAMLVPSVGRATGGRYAFAGGTPRQQAEVASEDARPTWTARFRNLVSGLIKTNTRRVGGDR
jgi:hypothetical protein